jgi:hypothetical protein
MERITSVFKVKQSNLLRFFEILVTVYESTRRKSQKIRIFYNTAVRIWNFVYYVGGKKCMWRGEWGRKTTDILHIFELLMALTVKAAVFWMWRLAFCYKCLQRNIGSILPIYTASCIIKVCLYCVCSWDATFSNVEIRCLDCFNVRV